MYEEAFGYNEKIPEEIRDVFVWVCEDVLSLHFKWELYYGLFGKEENRNLLVDVAGGQFTLIENSMRNDMLMIISRLNDPPESYGEENISIRALREKVGEVKNVPELCKAFKNDCKSVVQYRHKRIGHKDLKTHSNPRENEISLISCKEMEGILDILRKILDTIYQHFVVDGSLGFDVPPINRADVLLSILKTGRDFQRNSIAINKQNS